MGTFNGQSLTVTGDDPNYPVKLGADSVIPDLGLLKLTADGMTGKDPFTLMTLTGGKVTGVDCTIVRGDVFDEIIRSGDDETDKGNITVEVQGDDSRFIMNDQDVTIGGDVNYSVMGAENNLNNGPVNSNYVSTAINTYDDQKQEEQKKPHFDWTFLYGNFTLLQMQAIVTKLELDLSTVQVNGFKTEITDTELKINVTKSGVHLLNIESGGLNQVYLALYNEITGFAAKTRDLEAKVGPDVQCPPCSVGTN